MPDQPTELRCTACGKFLLGLSPDFDGAVSMQCPRCRTSLRYPSDADTGLRINCRCGKWLLSGGVLSGQVRVKCRREARLMVVTSADVIPAEPPSSRRGLLRAAIREAKHSRQAPRGVTSQSPDGDAHLVAMMEERWHQLREFGPRRSVDLAVGLRFDVFNRDGFRCRYCGRGPEQGVYLEADHVIPRSAGGPDSMANLVTACWDCNRGKSAKGLQSAV